MTEAYEYYLRVEKSLPKIVQSQLFGKPCFKINGKAFVCFFEDEMVFKLTGEIHSEALALDGSQLFDPSKKGRPMKEWVQVPFHYSDSWRKFAEAACDCVSGK
ncbi:MAG: hypothetical protein AB8B56_21390 [Crocinitomicaceae bacterium]